MWDLAPDLPAISADPTQVRQIVMNLITNASDALGDAPGIHHPPHRPGRRSAEPSRVRTTSCSSR